MTSMVRSSAVTLALGYIALGLLALVLFAAPLWYAWQGTIREGRAEILQADAQRLSDVYRRDGVEALRNFIDARLRMRIAGDRLLLLTAHPVAHSDCDLSVFDPSSATLLAADLLFVERVPSLDGRLKGWQSTLASLKTVAASRAVPGHGPVSVKWPSGARDLDRYLDVLLRETRAAVKKGMEISDAVASVGLSERGKWKLFDDYQGHNVTQAFKEVEWES